MRTLAEVAAEVPDDAVVGFGGKTLHRAPVGFARELVRQDVTGLTLLGVANSIEVDLLCGAGNAAGVHFGYVGFEALGLAPNFRRTVENGTVRALEGTCYTVVAMLRGAKQGVSFMPIAGLEGSDLPGVRDDFRPVECPFTGAEVYGVRSVRPDVAVIHANEADPAGNARFYGADLTEHLLAQAADHVVVTAERVVDADAFADAPENTDVPGVLVDEVVEVPYGAHPCSCPGVYEYDHAHLTEYLEQSRSQDGFDAYLEAYLGDDEAEYRERVGIDAAALAWREGSGGLAEPGIPG